jgi:hypothetical protein
MMGQIENVQSILQRESNWYKVYHMNDQLSLAFTNQILDNEAQVNKWDQIRF